MDWADKLAAKKTARGNPTDAETLRTQVSNQCASNMRLNGGNKKKETARLVKLYQDEDLQEELEHNYREKGIAVEGDDGKIGEVELPFADEEWADLLNREGELLGACCVTISRIRDILQGACRNDHKVNVEEFREAVDLAKGHGMVGGGKDPISRMIDLWELVKKDARVRDVDWSENVNEPKGALKALYHTSGHLCWDEIFNGGDKTQNHAQRQSDLATLKAVVGTLYHKMSELDEGPVEGWGVVGKNGEIGLSNTGIAVYADKKFAEEVCRRWGKKYSVKRVRVSMDGGVEILGEKCKK